MGKIHHRAKMSKQVWEMNLLRDSSLGSLRSLTFSTSCKVYNVFSVILWRIARYSNTWRPKRMRKTKGIIIKCYYEDRSWENEVQFYGKYVNLSMFSSVRLLSLSLHFLFFFHASLTDDDSTSTHSSIVKCLLSPFPPSPLLMPSYGVIVQRTHA